MCGLCGLLSCARMVCVRERDGRVYCCVGVPRVCASPPPPPVTGTHVTPVLGFLSLDPSDPSLLHPNPSEVASVFTLPLATLTDPGHKVVEQRPYNSDVYKGRPPSAPGRLTTFAMPAYLGGPAKVWGLTAYILEQVLAEVIVPVLQKPE